MGELSGTAAMQGKVSNIIKLMRERDEARKEAEQLRISNRALCQYNEYLLQRLQEIEGTQDETGGEKCQNHHQR